LDDRRRDGGTNSTLRTKEKGMHLTRNEHDDDDDDDDLKKNLSSGSRVVPCGQTDRRTDKHDATNSCFSLFCESA